MRMGPLRGTRIILVPAVAVAAALVLIVWWKTNQDLLPPPEDLSLRHTLVLRAQVADRLGGPLSTTYANRWNIHEAVPLHDMPPLLVEAFLAAEDRRFFRHHGVDWRARLHALQQNLRARRVVRGASTITEQVVRLWHPRPRTFWSRWLEGFEAAELERRFSKADILEFYLNQVPYARQRRGVLQAARALFGRDLDTLNPREMLALAVLVRAPSSLDLRRGTKGVGKAVDRLAGALLQTGAITEEEARDISNSPWSLGDYAPPVEAGHFVRHVLETRTSGKTSDRREDNSPRITTTLDASLQDAVQHILDARLHDLRDQGVTDGAVLVMDHHSDEVLAWVNGGGLSPESPAAWIDAVTARRQPGSTLKPFLYALALESGWTAASLIDDTPLLLSVRAGVHNLRNYSRVCYGPLRLREALGNSLNIPAVRTVQFTGTERFLDRLHELGFRSLDQSAAHYGEGLALGNGEVSLLELVQAYGVLARGGVFRPLRPELNEEHRPRDFVSSRRVFNDETTSIIADILSDPQARRLEFGEGNLLRLPVQTAVKTGTSSGHRDAWTLGFSHRHVVGVWMGNMDRSPTSGVTGTTGPALVLRAVFAELNRHEEAQPLPLSARLESHSICRVTGLRAGPHCPAVREIFVPGTVPQAVCAVHAALPLPPGEGNAVDLGNRATVAGGDKARPYGTTYRFAVGAGFTPARTVELKSTTLPGEGQGVDKPGKGIPHTPTLSQPSPQPSPGGRGGAEDTAIEGEREHSSVAESTASAAGEERKETLRLLQPIPGLLLAMDPRIPDESEAFAFTLSGRLSVERTEWIVDGRLWAATGRGENHVVWPLSRGDHVVLARVWISGSAEPQETQPVTFSVK